jgi:hypothetical protein
MIRRISSLAAVLGLLALAGVLPSVATAATEKPAWNLSLASESTNFAPGVSDPGSNYPLYTFVAVNVGGAPTSGTIVVTDNLPANVTPALAKTPFLKVRKEVVGACSVLASTITCTYPEPLGPGEYLSLQAPVEVSGALPDPSVVSNKVTITGGGADAASVTTATTVSTAEPPFAFLAGPAGFAASMSEADGSAAQQAGSHPTQFTINLGLSTKAVVDQQPRNVGTLRDLEVDLPRGMVVNPNATPVRCAEAQLETASCPDASQVGIVDVSQLQANVGTLPEGLYNMVPPANAPAELGFEASNVFVHTTGGVRPGDFHISSSTDNVLATVAITAARVQLWGDPSNPRYDGVRGQCGNGIAGTKKCHVNTEQQTPFLTMPSACSSSLGIAARADSWEESGKFVAAEPQLTDANGNPTGVSGCDQLHFNPSISIEPDTSSADSPTGLNVELKLPQTDSFNTFAQSTLKKAVVTLPEGMAVNPAAADGLASCSPAQIGLGNADKPTCPDGSKVGSIEVETPLLEDPLDGSVYLAKQSDNPFGSLLALYLVIEGSGIVVKLPGKVSLDPVTGRLSTSFDENPELPFSAFRLHFKGGSRAALLTPPSCGTYQFESSFVPWSAADPAKPTEAETVRDVDPFRIDSGPGGGPCPSGALQPHLNAGLQNPVAGSISPFLLRLWREDGTQRFGAVRISPPPGLAAYLKGIPYCPDSFLASIPTAPGTGAGQLASPTCFAASQVGNVSVGAGGGSSPFFVNTGRVFLVGPYKGAPLSLAIVTPAVAGPFDLGNVVVRAPAYVNPDTARITTQSDSLPTILDGVLIDVRDIRVNLDRPHFTFAPTNCSPMSVDGSVSGVGGGSAPVSDRFQVGACAALGFKPSVALRLKGAKKRGGNPALTATVTYPEGAYANTAGATATLPHSEFIDQANIRTVCTRVQFAAHNCPPGSIYGYAKAITPILDQPLTGPVYMRSSSHELPDLVVALKGPPSLPVEAVLVGRVDSVHGGIRNTFESTPDVPVSKFVLSLQGGRKSLLENSTNICRGTHRATVKLRAQNGKAYEVRPPLKANCGRTAATKKGKGGARPG